MMRRRYVMDSNLILSLLSSVPFAEAKGGVCVLFQCFHSYSHHWRLSIVAIFDQGRRIGKPPKQYQETQCGTALGCSITHFCTYISCCELLRVIVNWSWLPQIVVNCSKLVVSIIVAIFRVLKAVVVGRLQSIHVVQKRLQSFVVVHIIIKNRRNLHKYIKSRLWVGCRSRSFVSPNLRLSTILAHAEQQKRRDRPRSVGVVHLDW